MSEFEQLVLDSEDSTIETVFARLYGESMVGCPDELYIPPEALRIFLESFEGPLDLLLYLIRKQKFDVMDIPMAKLTEQYMRYVELVRENNLELAVAYLVMSATLMQIKSRLMLPAPPKEDGAEAEDPRAELMRRLLEYEKIREVAKLLNEQPREGRDFWIAEVVQNENDISYPDIEKSDLQEAWSAIQERMKLVTHHKVSREELSVREHMSEILKRLSACERLYFSELWEAGASKYQITVWFLALLELGKEGLVKLTQANAFGEIFIEQVDRIFGGEA